GTSDSTIAVPFIMNSNSPLQVQAGKLWFKGGANSIDATYDVSAGSELHFVGVTDNDIKQYLTNILNWKKEYNFANSHLKGAGDAFIDQAKVQQLGMNDAQRLHFNGGEISGNGILSIYKFLAWAGGTMVGGGVTQLIGAQAVIGGQSEELLNSWSF